MLVTSENRQLEICSSRLHCLGSNELITEPFSCETSETLRVRHASIPCTVGLNAALRMTKRALNPELPFLSLTRTGIRQALLSWASPRLHRHPSLACQRKSQNQIGGHPSIKKLATIPTSAAESAVNQHYFLLNGAFCRQSTLPTLV